MMQTTIEQIKNFGRARMAGFFRDMAISKGGTGELRRELTPKERAKRKKRKEMAKASKRRNR